MLEGGNKLSKPSAQKSVPSLLNLKILVRMSTKDGHDPIFFLRNHKNKKIASNSLTTSLGNINGVSLSGKTTYWAIADD